MTIGETIKHHRKKMGMTQSELAQAIGKSLSSLQKYEKGDTQPPIAVLENIAYVTGTTTTELINCGEEEVEPVEEYDAITILNLIKRGVLHPETAYSAVKNYDIQEMVETGISILEIPDTNTSERLFEVYLKALRDGTWNTGGKNDE